MARLTEEERAAWLALSEDGLAQPELRPDEKFVEQTTAGRQRYIEFATEAARFYKGEKPVRFVGEDWRL